jgi:16S rRNA (guanine1516-N2)-methyltransferase
LDATGGLGRDGFVLAWHGCRVTLVERHPVIAALLADGLRRASQDEKIGPLIRERIRLVIGDSLRVMPEMREAKVTNHGIRRQGLAHLPSSKRLQGTGVHEQADNTADSVPCDSLLAKPPEVIYLDPMYPESGKSALVKKETQLLRLLAGPDGDSNELLPAALACGRQRVVVKRPIAAPPLTGRKPDLVQAAGAHRFDIYLG